MSIVFAYRILRFKSVSSFHPIVPKSFWIKLKSIHIRAKWAVVQPTTISSAFSRMPHRHIWRRRIESWLWNTSKCLVPYLSSQKRCCIFHFEYYSIFCSHVPPTKALTKILKARKNSKKSRRRIAICRTRSSGNCMMRKFLSMQSKTWHGRTHFRNTPLPRQARAHLRNISPPSHARTKAASSAEDPFLQKSLSFTCWNANVPKKAMVNLVCICSACKWKIRDFLYH